MINYNGKRCNDNISDIVTEKNVAKIEKNVKKHFQKVLDALLIDTENDHNTQDTAKRVAKMLVREVFAGRYEPKPRITSFPNANQYDQLYITGPIKVRSTCAHHFQPIIGNAWVGIFPGENVIGLSKFNRLVDWVASRPQIQEEAGVMLADELESLIKPLGLAVIMKATHTCITWRGVKDNDSTMVSSVMRGEFLTDTHQKEEFLGLIRGQGF